MWSVIDTISDVDDALGVRYELFLDVVNKYAPLKEERVKHGKQPDWMNEVILQKMAQRDHFKSIGDENNYKHYRNLTNDLIEKTKTEYYRTLVEQNQSNSKKLWSYL